MFGPRVSVPARVGALAEVYYTPAAAARVPVWAALFYYPLTVSQVDEFFR